MFKKIKQNIIIKRAEGTNSTLHLIIKKWAGPYNFTVTHDEKNIYIKLYYDERPNQKEINKLYVGATNLFNADDYDFTGLTEYMLNKEICFIFRKK